MHKLFVIKHMSLITGVYDHAIIIFFNPRYERGDTLPFSNNHFNMNAVLEYSYVTISILL